MKKFGLTTAWSAVGRRFPGTRPALDVTGVSGRPRLAEQERRPPNSGRKTDRVWGLIVFALAAVLATLGATYATPAAAETVHEISGRWGEGTPDTVKPGDPVTAEWRVNINDDRAAPSNEPVDNVTFTAELDNGRFTSLPDACLTEGATPASSISADGSLLTCNLGTKTEGTAVVVHTSIEADGPSGSQLTGIGRIDGQAAQLPPIRIIGEFGMDIRWGVATRNFQWGGDFQGNQGYVDLDFQWTLSKNKGSEAGPSQVTYDLTLNPSQAASMQVGPRGCDRFSFGTASGHPWSGGTHPQDQMNSFVGSCQFVHLGGNNYRLTLSGIDYQPATPPTRDSTGARLPSDQVALATGSVWVRLYTQTSGSAELVSNAPTYTSVNGATDQDDPSNNRVTKTFTTPGPYASAWTRDFTNSGGSNWDYTYRVTPGTLVRQVLTTGYGNFDRADNLPVGMCAALDTRFVDFERAEWEGPPGVTIEYYTGSAPAVDPNSAFYDPWNFECDGVGGWSAQAPADLTAVRAVRVRTTQGVIEGVNRNVPLYVYQRIENDVPVGQDVWAAMKAQAENGSWFRVNDCITPTPGEPGDPERYPCTTTFHDIVRMIEATPTIDKTVDKTVVGPGERATYTLTYAATTAGPFPPSVDDFEIRDVLPVGMTYVSGSASPEPTISTDPNGRQVLTWTFDDVATNQPHVLTYQAELDSDVQPGEVLINTATPSIGNAAGQPDDAAVRLITDGYTAISKVADTPYIPNPDGNGDGEGSWTVTLRSYDPLPQDFTDTIDVLPYRGDGRGTDYAGDYSLVAVEADPGATVYYTTEDPSSLSDDPADESNGSAGDISGNTVGWTTTFTPDATAIRVIGPELVPGGIQRFRVRIASDGAEGGDVLVNRAQARAEHTELTMRTSDPITVANHYSASLKKYVQDRDGVWRDANEALDYPEYRYGDRVTYRIVVTNTGQGTLRNVDISDDRFPEGSFHIDVLAPGESQAHEFSIILDKTTIGGDSIVNTACAEADTPPDSQEPPTINCDPAGVKIANYRTEKTSDPEEGSKVRPGDKVTYTVTVTQEGDAPANARFVDDLSDVLDDADYNDDVRASVGTAQFIDGRIYWTGLIPVGEKAEITYSVTVKSPSDSGDGDFHLRNVVTSPGCPSEPDPCETVHWGGSYVYAKTSDPAPGTKVRVGDVVEYSVWIRHLGRAPVLDARVTDDLSDVLDDATYNGDARATSGSVEVNGDTLLWRGDLREGDRVRLSYSVTVVDAGDDWLRNVVVGGPGSECVPAPDQNPDCRTEHPKAPPSDGGGDLPDTGSNVSLTLLGLGLGLLALGAGTVLTARVRRKTDEPEEGFAI